MIQRQALNLLNALVCESLPVEIRITRSPKRMRGLFATRKLSVNDLIGKVSPLAAWSTNMQLNCLECGVKCGSSVDLCQLWQEHATIAKNAQASRFQRVTERLMLRVWHEHLAGYANSRTILASLVTPNYGNTIPAEWQTMWNTSADILQQSAPGILAESSPVMLESYISCLASLHLNSVKVNHDTTALYSVLSFLNHSCEPNVLVAFDGAHAVLMTARAIEAGDELFIHYHHQLDNNFEQLQEYLQWNYGVACDQDCVCGKLLSRKNQDRAFSPQGS